MLRKVYGEVCIIKYLMCVSCKSLMIGCRFNYVPLSEYRVMFNKVMRFTCRERVNCWGVLMVKYQKKVGLELEIGLGGNYMALVGQGTYDLRV